MTYSFETAQKHGRKGVTLVFAKAGNPDDESDKLRVTAQDFLMGNYDWETIQEEERNNAVKALFAFRPVLN